MPRKQSALVKQQDYDDLLADLKEHILAAQLRAAQAVNRELISLYWSVGNEILQRMRDQGWGAKVIERLADDLRSEFPDTKGFSARNLRYMRDLAAAYPDPSIWQQLLPNCPWGHVTVLLYGVRDEAARNWYARQAVEHGWSRKVLQFQIDCKLYERQGKAVTNFSATLPSPQSELAQELTKDPYMFDFLALGPRLREREIERGLLENLAKLLLELGKGFAFLGSQFRIRVRDEDYFLDLLFYNVRLHCYVVIELKTDKFKPEYAGKMNFYLSAIDDQLRSPVENPSIGIILCRDHDHVVVEYALRDMTRPMGVARYAVTPNLPADLQEALPTAEELARLTREITAAQPRRKET